MNKNFVKEKLKQGNPVIGIWSIINSPAVAEIMSVAGLDFQILDMEHGVFDLPSLEASVRSCEAAGCSPLVRVPGIQPTVIQSCLDLGAHGVVVPQVKGAVSAKEAIQAAKFAPQGTRGFNPFTRAGGYCGGAGEHGAKLGDDFGLTSVIIENKTANDELDEILTLPGLDMVYLGVYDMSVAMGLKGEVGHPSILKFLETSIPRIRDAGKAAGLMVKNGDEIKKYLDMGANLLVYGVDSFMVHRVINEGVTNFAAARKARNKK